MFDTTAFMPHGMCFLWQPRVLMLHIASDALIALAYFSIPVILVYVVRMRLDLPFRGAFWMFSAFIVACGLTHVASIVVIWYPLYWLEGYIKALTAVLSCLTAVSLVRILPQIFSLRSPAELERVNRSLEVAAEQLLADSVTDALTGISNRRGFDVRLSEALTACRRAQTQASLLMIDIDDFKAFNDTYGHPAGDACLKTVATAIKSAVNRPRDHLARIGGEEFAVIMEDADSRGARLVAERIRHEVAAANVQQGNGASFPVVTVSVGAATVVTPEETQHAMLLLLADQALYQSKAKGRNCVVALEISAASA